MKIIIDAFGGDYSPDEMIKGAIVALNQNKEIEVVLTGKQDVIEQKLKEITSQKEFALLDRKRLSIIDASEVITCDDKPTEAIRAKKDSSLVKAFESLKQDDEAVAVISAGSTGAVLTGAFMKVGRIKGVSRPTLCPALPTAKGTPVVLIDSGANMDCKPLNLIHFAVMGSVYYKSMFGADNPRVAILNVGTEDEKGNELVKKTLPYLKQLDINFVGSMEARDFLSGDYDVVVCDGFAGNTLLKGCEGAVMTVVGLIKGALKNGNLLTKVGAGLIKKPLKSVLKKFDYTNYGGSPFLGVNKTVIKVHGNSKYGSIVEAVKQAVMLQQNKCNENVKLALENLSIELPQD